MGDLKHELSQQQIERLRELWDAGVASGSAGKLDIKKLRREARANLKAASTMSPNKPRHTRA
jgi:antitoxin ParD1/3/4